MAWIICLLCAAQLKKRTDKNGKPYFVCEPCGVQLFIRRRRGIKNLDELMKQLSTHDYHFREHTRVLCEIQAVLAEMRGVKEEIRSIESKFDLLSSDKDKMAKERTIEALELRIKNLLGQLSQLARRGSKR